MKLFGHPVYPMLIVFPVGLFATAFVFDILYLIIGNADFSTVSFYMIAAVSLVDYWRQFSGLSTGRACQTIRAQKILVGCMDLEIS